MPYSRFRAYWAMALVLGVVLPLCIQHNTAQARAVTGFLTFETGSDAQAVSLPGITFATQSGDEWLYGDVRTRKYNAPYPQSCADRPGKIATAICEYSVSENFFAWPGEVEAQGTLIFTQGTASFVEFDIATGATTTFIAYSADDRPIAAASLRANTSGGNNRAVVLDAPEGERIAYVTISGTASLWLLDNLATDAPGVPDQRPPASPRAAQVSVVIRSAPNLAVAPGDVVTLTIVATNRGRGGASDTLIRLPLRGLPLRVLDATPSRAGAWVSQLDSEALVINSGPLGSGGDTVSIAVRVQVLDDAPLGAPLGARLAYSWADKARGGEGLSNLPMLVVAARPASAEIYSLDPLAGEAAATLSSFGSAIFAPKEPVALWYDTPDGESLALGTLTVDADGQLFVTVDTAETASGRYTLVARGLWTEFTATAPLNVP